MAIAGKSKKDDSSKFQSYQVLSAEKFGLF